MRHHAMAEPCLYCDRLTGDWNEPCIGSTDGLHWTRESKVEHERNRAEAAGRSLYRAALELDKAADRIEALPRRLARKVVRAQRGLDPDLLRNEAERARDTLHVYGLLDV